MLAFVMTLSGCGGGGGGGGPSGPRFSLSSNKLTFSALTPGAYVAPQSIGATVTGLSGGTVYFLILVSGTAVQTVSNVTITGPTTGVADVIPASSASLGSGTHTGTITVVACVNDPSCSSGAISGSPQVVDVTYQVGGVVTAPSSANFSVVEGAVPPSIDVNVSSALASGPLTTSVSYTSGTSGWLSIAPASAASLPAALSLSASSMPAGSYSAVVSLNAGGVTLPFPVTYSVIPKLAVSSSAVAFSAVKGQIAMPAPMIVPVTSPGGGPVSFSPSVSYGPGATGWLNVTGSSAPGNVSIVPNSTDLTAGATYNASVTLTPNGGGSPDVINVSYTVASSVLTLSSSSQSFSIDVASTSSDEFLKRIVTTGDTGAPLNWTASSSAPWLTVTGSGASGDPVVLTLVPAALGALPNGPSNATVTFGYTGAGGTSGQVSLSVTVNLNLPTVAYVSPYAAKAGTPGTLILRGTGFNALGGRALAIGNTTVSSYTVISDSEIRADYPALGAGTYPVRFSTPLDIGGAVTLALITPPAYAAQALAYPSVTGRQPLRVIYDAERNALLVAVAYPTAGSGGDILRYSYSGTSWGATPITQFVPTFRDLAISPDGKKLVALSQSAVAQFDAVTLAAGPLTNATFLFAGFEFLRSVAMTNDGKALVTTGVFGSGFTATKAYDVGTASFLGGTAYSAVVYFGSATASMDGSRVFLAHGGGVSPAPEQMYYDASLRVLAGTGINLNVATEAMLDRSGSRIVLNGQQVFNGSFQSIGSIPCGVGVLSPDGSRAHCYDWFGDRKLHTFDLSVPPTAGVFPESGTAIPLAGDPGVMPRMAISPDGKTVFIAGDAAIVVQPVP
jgi:hypothetical protein